MVDEQAALQNFADLVDKIVVKYNKGVVLDYVTRHSFQIINSSMEQLEQRFETILSVFEEIQKESSSSAANANHVDDLLDAVLSGRKTLQKEIHNRLGEIDEAAATARTTAASFETLKEHTGEVKAMVSDIQNISIKTGILAINASIEAAHAGKAGDGFRIIANEVRNLSTKTGTFAKMIETKMAELQSSVKSISESMTLFISLFSKFQESFTGILSTYDKNSETLDAAGLALAEISSSIKEQDTTIHGGFSSLKDIEAFLKETSAVLEVVQTSHRHLGTLLQKKE
ncbi:MULTISPECIES: methyl-accepting chemotaxis protein [unclassified Treponema]|uniref:methyl-accepting chemotaxis protein n=1 Tax=unclassified Treponema TaxID=2638727 RepID=UPI0020A24F9B|nr:MULTISPECIES: methyl-accepting chemotaxis protein [unclassified Treponema]UTC44385.1 methyl-accepting chemotaxis protein [Treponema sp. OMZ 857]UTC51207.1 methyl-accepting chemotaxis protein [Treponema sp. OMZ 855]